MLRSDAPLLRLHVDRIEAQHVFADDAVDAAVAASSNTLGGVGFRTAIAERNEHVEDNVLEEAVITLDETPEELLGERSPDLTVSRIDRLLRSGCRDWQLLWSHWLSHSAATRASRAELDVHRELLEH